MQAAMMLTFIMNLDCMYQWVLWLLFLGSHLLLAYSGVDNGPWQSISIFPKG